MYALRTMLSAHQTLPYAGRRTSTNTKDNTLNNRLAYVEALVDTNALVIETMWTFSNSTTRQQPAAVVPLRTFIQEVLKRSRTTYSTLQTALFYLFRCRPAITAHLQQTRQDKWEGAYISCGRRMFLASLVVASKFVQDKTYRNSAWAKIAGLPVAEINASERIFLNMVDYRLYISQPTFEQWHHLLHMHVEAKTQQHPLILLPHNLNSSVRQSASSLPPFTSVPSSSSPSSSPSPSSSSSSSPLSYSSSSSMSSPASITPPTSVFPLPPSLHPSYHHYQYQPLSCHQQQFGHHQHYYEPTMKRKRQHTSSDTLSPSSTPVPVLTVSSINTTSLPSSNHSSPLQTPTQISPIRCQLWKPISPKKRKLDSTYYINQPTRPSKQ
ncbi:unnamed protein product [Absidia cylindrospora]